MCFPIPSSLLTCWRKYFSKQKLRFRSIKGYYRYGFCSLFIVTVFLNSYSSRVQGNLGCGDTIFPRNVDGFVRRKIFIAEGDEFKGVVCRVLRE